MKKFRWLVPVLLLLALLLFTAIGYAGGNKSIGLVVQFPDGSVKSTTVTVPVDATAADVLAASSFNAAIASSSYGPALCGIDNQGCGVDNCFCDANHFWAYYHLVHKQWQASAVGIGGYTPADHAVEGFAWSGFDANYAPTVQPPVMTYDQIVGAQPVPVPEPATIFLVGSGIVGLAAYTRRRRAA